MPVVDANGDQGDTVGTSGAGCTVGSVVLKAQQSVPAGWIPADGRTLPVARSPKLAAALGATYGGDGTTNFALPALTAPPGLRWDVCADGNAWKAGAGDACTLGRVGLFATAGLPSNWTPADGRRLSIRADMVLFSLIETSFGGDGITTFAVPDPPAPAAHTRWGICTSGSYPASRSTASAACPQRLARARAASRIGGMCRNIRTLYNFEPPATEDEVHAAAVQYVRKISGFTRPSRANEAAFERAVRAITATSRELLASLETNAPPKDRDVEAAKARARAQQRYAA